MKNGWNTRAQANSRASDSVTLLNVRAERETLQQQEAAEIGTRAQRIRGCTAGEPALQKKLIGHGVCVGRGALLGLRAQSHEVLKHLC